MKNPM